jgi:hypothetical protein
MDTITIFLVLGILIITNVIAFFIYKRKYTWKMVFVEKNDRGVNSDTWYWEIPSHDGKRVWLTDEQLLTGKVRANGLQNHPHIKIDTI